MGKKPFARTFPTEEELESRADEPLGAFERKEHLVREKLVEVESVKVRSQDKVSATGNPLLASPR